MPTNDDDDELAARVADAAGRLLMEIRGRTGGARGGPGPGADHLGTAADQLSGAGDQLGAVGDSRSHELIVAALHEARPDDRVLSEEDRADTHRAGARRVWIVDPLDGTREYSEGRPDFAVHVALVENGIPVAGAVALPAEAVVLATRPAPTLAERAAGPIRIAVSRTRPPDDATALAERLDAVLVPMGSAGAKAMAVVRGTVDAYIHAGGQYEWDSAAPVAVARAAGVHASRLDGSPLVYDQPDPWLPDLLVCRPELADILTTALGHTASER